ncbi:hypothetical protein [Burkholderia ubonensis]|uniref:hypothetical protein n=1 Tax=Burkholderia ubonensis TaxID=101571 RepID=UPI0008FE43DD|nr:hypothetical protein [Burkholderia ubonensis]OJB06311.1 hypothetical protein BGV48_15950 [Burkholderia ubonensis]
MKVTIKGFIFAEPNIAGNLVYTFAEYDRSQLVSNVVKVREHSFEVEVTDDFDPRAALIANLEREKKKLQAEFNARIVELNGRIQSLLAIENGAQS